MPPLVLKTNTMKNEMLSEAYKILYRMTFNKIITETVRRAIRVRLQVILDIDLKRYEDWKEDIKPKLNYTRQKQIEREFRKRIQAYKITIHSLTPYFERLDDIPMFVVRKPKKE